MSKQHEIRLLEAEVKACEQDIHTLELKLAKNYAAMSFSEITQMDMEAAKIQARKKEALRKIATRKKALERLDK